jgi:hypothetical protein
MAFVLLCAAALAFPLSGHGAGVPVHPVRAVVFGDFNGPYGSTAYPPAVAAVVR